MFKISLIGVCAVILSIHHTFCQQRNRYARDSNEFRNVREMQIQLDTTERSSSTNVFPFKSVTIADVRFDTTYVAIYAFLNTLFIPAIKNHKINFEGGAGKGCSIYLNHFFQNNLAEGDKELVCFLKKLTIIKRDTLREYTSLYRALGQITFQTEVFLRDGKDFYAAFKIDTVLIERVGVKKREISGDITEYLIMPALRLLQSKISTTDWDKVVRKRPFPESMVYENYFSKRFNLPILTQAYKKGVYTKFYEFSNNSPSITDFKIKASKFGGVAITDKNGNNLVTTKIFGFSDGQRCWIQNGIYCYPLIRTGNSFEFFMTISGLRLLLVVDMDEGKIR